MMTVFAAYFVMGLLSAVPGVSILLIPAQIALSFVQNVFSMFMAGWFLAAFAGVAFKAQGLADVR
jgi:hypothetical protein